ncbi:MAG: HIT family protein [Deltaproteobacteria bacterium]|nr:HIT family protein [Deltaproteobacteria bacterium]
MACVFCRIAGGEIPAEVIAREDGATAFLDVTPLADGHVLVIPNVHVGRVEDLEPDTAAALFRAVHRIVGPIRAAVGAEGTTIGINDGAATGQTVPHVHVHVVPRRTGDGAGSVHSIFPHGTRQELASVARAIRSQLERA